MAGKKDDVVVGAVAGEPYWDEKRNTTVAPDGATPSFGADAVSAPAPEPEAAPEATEGGEE